VTTPKFSVCPGQPNAPLTGVPTVRGMKTQPRKYQLPATATEAAKTAARTCPTPSPRVVARILREVRPEGHRAGR